MSQSERLPIVGVSACFKWVDNVWYHAVQEKYVTSVMVGAKAQPVIIPALGAATDIDRLLSTLDGVVFTGSPSNVEPHHYAGPDSRDGTLHDAERDATTLPLIRAALDRGVPLFCICRGIQELNVALGGTLHQHLEEVPGRADHRNNPDAPMDDQYAPRHRLAITAGGVLAGITGVTEATINSLHGQGIDRVAPGLTVEGVAPDGTIEAVSVTDASGFAVGVQWHPEWKVIDNHFNLSLFQAFGDACRNYARKRPSHDASGRVA